MSEVANQTDDNLWDFPRTSPVFKATVHSESIELVYGNTDVYRFAGHLAVVDHVYMRFDDGVSYAFENADLMDELERKGFPTHSLPYPCDSDSDVYRKFIESRIEKELGELQ